MAHGVVIALLVSAAWMSLQLAAMHVWPARNRLRVKFFCYLASLPFVYILYRWMPMPVAIARDPAREAYAMGLFHAYFLHLLMFLLYAECFFHIERAVTLRFMIEIMRHPAEATPLTDITRQYGIEHMIGTRLKVLEQKNFIEKRDGRWHLKPKGLLFAKAMRVSNWVYQSAPQDQRM
jgi:hypothetical protein